MWLDETAEPLAAILRPGNAGANNAADHVRLLGEAIDALPGDYQTGHRPGDDPATVRFPLLVWADSAGATHDFLNAAVARNAEFSVGFAIDARVRDAIERCQEEDWIPAVNRDGAQRPNGYVIELTKLVDLDNWPPGTRLICRRERPHPGAQLTMFDTVNGWRQIPDRTSDNQTCRQLPIPIQSITSPLSRTSGSPVPREVFDRIHRVLLLDAVSELLVSRAEGSSAGVVLAGPSGAFEELVGYVASEANAEGDRRRARLLDEACAMLDAALGGR